MSIEAQFFICPLPDCSYEGTEVDWLKALSIHCRFSEVDHSSLKPLLKDLRKQSIKNFPWEATVTVRDTDVRSTDSSSDSNTGLSGSEAPEA